MPHDGLPTPFAEMVLDLVDTIPPGRVMAYSDIADALGRGGARQVGQVMSRYGSGVPWWRVLRTDGSCAPVQVAEQLELLRTDGTPFVDGRVDMARARWRP